MKRKYLVLSGLLFLCLVVILFFNFKNNEGLTKNKMKNSAIVNKKSQYSFLIVQNQPRLIKAIKYSKVIPKDVDEVYFDVSGELIIEEMDSCIQCPIKEGQLLFRINNREVLSDLIQSKKVLYNSISEILPKIEVSYPKEITKWNNFLKTIKPTTLLSLMPSFSSESEKELFYDKGILKFYSDVLFSEKHMEKYFYLAPYDGFLLKSYIKNGKSIKSGDLVASISKSKDLITRFSISKNEFDLTSKNIILYNDSKKEIGKGVLKEFKVNPKTNNIDVYYTIDGKVNNTILMGNRLSVEFNSKLICCKLPSFLVKHDKVKVLEGKKIKFKRVVVVNDDSKDLLVRGLFNGMKIIL